MDLDHTTKLVISQLFNTAIEVFFLYSMFNVKKGVCRNLEL